VTTAVVTDTKRAEAAEAAEGQTPSFVSVNLIGLLPV